MTFTLEAALRTELGKKVAALRAEGNLPAVMYGPKQAPTPLTISKIAFDKVFKEAGESSVVTLTGLDTPKDVLVQEVEFDPRRGGIVHVDFYAVEKGKKIAVDVPLHFIGEAPAMKLGGTLTKVLHEIEVVAEATKLPKEISVDISTLVDLTSRIYVRDLTLPDGVTTKNAADDVVALIQEVVEEVEAAPALDMSAIEVEKKGKTEEVPPTA
jgi:large subunit ribosomal protein L25